ncbi:unnamed protein product [Closterium sp. NIES-65]|nr:unnamed protein product [Closterium sp. NIES-65]
MTQFLTLLSFSSPHPLLLSSPPPLPLSSPPPLPLSSPPPLPISSPPLLPISSRPPLPSPLHLPSPSPPPPLLISPPPPFHLSSPPPLPSPSPLPLPSPLHLLPPSPPHLLFPSPSLPREHNPLFLPTRPALSSARQLTAASSESHRALVQVHTGNNLPLLSPQPSHNPLPPPSLCLPAASMKQDRAHREHTLPILLPPLPHNSPLTPLLPPPAPPPTPPTLIPHPYLFSALLASYRQRAVNLDRAFYRQRAVNLDRALFQAHRGHKLMRDVRPAVTRFHVFMGIASLLELRPMGARHLNPPLLPQKPTTRPSSANSYESPPLKSSSSPSTAPLPALLSPPQLARLQLDQGVSSLPAIRPMGALPPLSTGVHHRHPTCHVPFPLALPTARAPGCNWIKASRPFLHYVLWLQLDQGAAALPALRPMGARQLYMADVIDSDEHYFSTVACQKARFNRSLLNASLHFATFAKGSPGKFTFPVLDCVLCPANPIHSHEHHFSTVACHSPHFNRTLLNASLHFAKASPSIPSLSSPSLQPLVSPDSPIPSSQHSLEHSLKMNDSFYKAFTSGVVLFARKFPRNSQTLDRIDRLLQHWHSLYLLYLTLPHLTSSRPSIPSSSLAHLPFSHPSLHLPPRFHFPILPHLLAGSCCSGSLIASPPALGALSLPPLPPTMPRLPIFTQHLTPQAAVMAPLAAAAVLVL